MKICDIWVDVFCILEKTSFLIWLHSGLSTKSSANIVSHIVDSLYYCGGFVGAKTAWNYYAEKCI